MFHIVCLDRPVFYLDNHLRPASEIDRAALPTIRFVRSDTFCSLAQIKRQIKCPFFFLWYLYFSLPFLNCPLFFNRITSSNRPMSEKSIIINMLKASCTIKIKRWFYFVFSPHTCSIVCSRATVALPFTDTTLLHSR